MQPESKKVKVEANSILKTQSMASTIHFDRYSLLISTKEVASKNIYKLRYDLNIFNWDLTRLFK